MDIPSRPARPRRTLATLGVAAGLGLWLAANANPSDPAPTAHSDSAGAAIDDAAITTKVKANFIGDDRLKGSHIHVTTTNGVVTLKGTAPSADSKAAAEELAHHVDGVKSVDDELRTGANGTMHKAVATTEREGSDSWITTKVKSEILADSMSKGFKVRVTTVNGVVMLRGTLPNDDAVAHVKDLAEKVEGVKSVDTTRLITGG
jgi:hyperosmotically inducible protein